MRVWLLPLRAGGRKLPERRDENDWMEGLVHGGYMQRGRAPTLEFKEIHRSVIEEPTLVLYDWRVLSIGGDRIVIRGIEAVRGAAVVQEWRLAVNPAIPPKGGRAGPPLGETKPYDFAAHTVNPGDIKP